MTVAQALTNQRLVLEQITQLNTTTPTSSNRPASCSRRTPRRSTNRPPAATIPLETLQRAFQNIYDTMDAIDNFKLKALDSMKTTVDALGNEGREVQRLYRPGRGRAAGRAERPADTYRLEAM